MTLVNDDGTKLLDDPRTTTSDWRCTECGQRLLPDPKTTLLGGYGRGHGPGCSLAALLVLVPGDRPGRAPALTGQHHLKQPAHFRHRREYPIFSPIRAGPT